MTDQVRVPDPVKKRIDAEAERRDIGRGAVVEQWMHKADQLDKLLEDFKDSVQTRAEL